jgi:DNA-binding protein H-NS
MTKTRTYTQIVKQIETLKAEAEKLRRGEIEGVVTRIREAISHYGLTAADLGLAGVKAKPGPKPGTAVKGRKRRGKAAAKPTGVVKYRNESGGTWGGRGKRPTWLRDALASGKQLSDFLVK